MCMLLVSTGFGVIVFCSRTLFARDVFYRTYQLSITMRVDTTLIQRTFHLVHIVIFIFRI